MTLCGQVRAQQPTFFHLGSDQGLSQGDVFDIVQDTSGFIWLATRDGLNRWDGYQIKTFRFDPEDPTSLPDNYVHTLTVAADGGIWAGTRRGLCRYDPAMERFTRKLLIDSEGNAIEGFVYAVVEDRKGGIWVGTVLNGLFHLGADGAVAHYRPEENNPHSLVYPEIWALLLDSKQRLWIGTSHGLDVTSLRSPGYFDHVAESIPDRRICALAEDGNGMIWIGTWRGGLVRLDPETGKFRNWSFGKLKDPSNEVRAVVEDQAGFLWAATGKGLRRYNPQTNRFTVFRHHPDNPRGLRHDRLRTLCIDRGGVLWVGSGQGASYLTPNSRQFAYYGKVSGQSIHERENRVSAVIEDSLGRLWTGHESGLYHLEESEGQQPVLHRILPREDHADLISNEVTSLYEDRSGDIWVGTNGSGIGRYRPTKGNFLYWLDIGIDKLPNNRITRIVQNLQGVLWVATQNGLAVSTEPLQAEQSPKFRHFLGRGRPGLQSHTINDIVLEGPASAWLGTEFGVSRFHTTEGIRRLLPETHGLSHPRALSLLLVDKTLWIGTPAGLNRLDTQSGYVTVFSTREGLPNDVVKSIQQDRQGYLWLATNQGLSRLDPHRLRFRNYTVDDGLQGNEFNIRARYQAADGRLFFGGPAGLTAFYPDRLAESPLTRVVLTSFQLSQIDIDPSMNSVLTRSITGAETLRLSSNDLFGFEFSALDFANPRAGRYRHRMVGLHDWIETDTEHRYADYTNLWEGRYTFQVQATRGNRGWNGPVTSLDLIIEPPLWRHPAAYAGYSLTVLLLIYLLIRAQRNKLQRERLLVDRLRHLDQLKDSFLANTSHELRTPLNGIVGLVEALLTSSELPKNARQDLSLVLAGGRRLTWLVNDILDFSKMKNQEMMLQRQPVDLYTIIEEVFRLSRAGLEGRVLVLANMVSRDLPAVDADPNRLQQILHNLIGNAVKFTEKGTVTVTAEKKGKNIITHVADTGIGIPEEKLERIFESFEQADGDVARRFGGTGLGLAITRQLVELHGGKISVVSTPGRGSVFSFTLSQADRAAKMREPAMDLPAGSVLGNEEEEVARPDLIKALPGLEGKTFHLLVVDDEAVNRRVIINHLRGSGCTITQAAGGREACAEAARKQFDLILLDIMMPGMTGYEVCRRIREHFALHELPILFLTARTRVEDLAQGFLAGGNDYLTKPISRTELVNRVSMQLQLLESRRDLQALNREIQAREKQKTDALRVLTAGIAHEISNAVTTIGGGLHGITTGLEDFGVFLNEIAGDDAPPEVTAAIDERLNAIASQGKKAIAGNNRIRAVVHELYRFTRFQKGKVRRVMLTENIDAALSLILPDYPGVEVVRRYHDPLGISCNPAEMSLVFLHIIVNACEAMDSGRTAGSNVLTISTRLKDAVAEVTIGDNGRGMTPETRARIFEPFFSTKEKNRGSGLGLSTSLGIIEGHGGNMDVSSSPGHGTIVKLTLPVLG
ncbi:MAG: ATP-binding protein [Acidobacteriota bacterium]|nr:ATP-binding protein [Acidobacteriota bacterium]